MISVWCVCNFNFIVIYSNNNGNGFIHPTVGICGLKIQTFCEENNSKYPKRILKDSQKRMIQKKS